MLIRAINFTFGRQLISLVLQLILMTILARWLNPEGFGEFGVLVAFTLLSSIGVTLGINNSLIYYLSIGKVSGRGAFTLVNTYLIVSLILSLAISLLLFMLTNLECLDIFVYVFSIVFYSYISLVSAIHQGQESYTKLNLVILTPTLILLFSIILLKLLNTSLLLNLVKISFLFSYVLTSCIAFFSLKKEMGGTFFRYVNLYRMIRVYSFIKSYGGVACITNFVTVFNYKIQILIVSAVFSTDILGYFNLANQLLDKMFIIVNSIMLVLLPRLGKVSLDERYILVKKITAFVMLISILCLVSFYFVGEFLVKLVFGDEFSDSYGIVVMMLPSFIFLSTIKVLSGFFSASGKPLVNLYMAFLFLVVNILFTLLALSERNVEIVALAYSFAAFFTLTAYLFVLRANRCSFVNYHK